MDADALFYSERGARPLDDDFFIAARRFYRDALGGRELGGAATEGHRCLWFLVEHQCLAVRPRSGLPAPLTLEVEDPEAIAVRCWDAGYTIEVAEAAAAEGVLSVIDPFGQRVELTTSMHNDMSARLPNGVPYRRVGV